MAGGITYNSNNLQTSSILSQDIDHASIPTKTINSAALAHGNKTVIPFIEYPNKTITVKGVLIGTSISNLETLIDTFKGYFSVQDKNLDLDYAGSTRRYIATATNIRISRPGGLAYAPFEITFLCTAPWGFDISTTTLVNTSGNTAGTYNPTFTIAGNAPFQYPVITLTYTVMTGNTGSQTVTINNANNGQGISIARAWSATDVIAIDCYNKTVKVNGTDVSFTGAFPEFKPGSNGFGYTDPFTTRTFAFNAVYTLAYL